MRSNYLRCELSQFDAGEPATLLSSARGALEDALAAILPPPGSLKGVNREDFTIKSGLFTGPFGPLMARIGASRCRHGNLRVRELSPRASRAPYALWEPISDTSAQKRERFLIFWNSNSEI